MTQEAIILDEALDAPPELVWRALTEPDLLARWLAPNDIRAIVGERFTLRPDGAVGQRPIECEVLEAEPPERLSYRWRGGEPGAPDALDTVVTWIIEPAPGGGSRLRLIHDGFPIVVEQPARTAEVVDLAARRASRIQARYTTRSLAWAA
jgi:uncharacterized protein YndB with AHSA1/START domain